MLDMSFGENQCRTRKDQAATNLGELRRTALSLLKNQTSEQVEIKNRRLIVGYNTDDRHKGVTTRTSSEYVGGE